MIAKENNPAAEERAAEQTELIAAYDPGERTGWCAADIHWDQFDPKTGEGFDIIAQGVKDYSQMQDWAIDNIAGPARELHTDTIIYETWRLYGTHAKALIGNDMQPSQIVGLIRLVGRALGKKLKSQNATIKTVANATMPDWIKEHMSKSTEIHDQDAIRHAWHYAYSEWVRRNK